MASAPSSAPRASSLRPLAEARSDLAAPNFPSATLDSAAPMVCNPAFLLADSSAAILEKLSAVVSST